MNRQEFIEKLPNASSSIDEKYISTQLQRSIDANVKEHPNNPAGHFNLIIVMEELSELQKEVSKSLRGKEDLDGILEEMADVYLALRYIKMIHGISDESINKAINIKIDRMKNILDTEGIMR